MTQAPYRCLARPFSVNRNRATVTAANDKLSRAVTELQTPLALQLALTVVKYGGGGLGRRASSQQSLAVDVETELLPHIHS